MLPGMAPALPDGLTSRAPTLDDAVSITRLVRACDIAVTGESDYTVDEVVATFGYPGVDHERGGRVVLDSNGAIVGWLWTELDEAAQEVFVDVFCQRPDVSNWLYDYGLAFADRLSAESEVPLGVYSGCFATDAAYAQVIESHGLTVDRRFWRMRLDLDPQQPYVAPTLPPGVTLEVAPDDDAGRRLVHRLNEAAFVDHWHNTPRTFDDWYERVLASVGDDPAQRYIALVEGEPAGLLVADDSLAEQRESWVRTLGVLREFRGRGVAKSLLANAFAAASTRGQVRVSLTVDSESPTGATRLYEGMGMAVASEIAIWNRPPEPRRQ